MNKHKNITLDNINQIKGEMKECLKYFTKWWDASVALRKDKEHTEWAKYFVCQKMYNKNLWIQVPGGFLFFAHCLLKNDKSVKCVPFLYSNQSSLESHFSQMRARRADTLQGYITGLASIGGIKTNKALTMHHNKMYTHWNICNGQWCVCGIFKIIQSAIRKSACLFQEIWNVIWENCWFHSQKDTAMQLSGISHKEYKVKPMRHGLYWKQFTNYYSVQKDFLGHINWNYTIQEFIYACQKSIAKIMHLFCETCIASDRGSLFFELMVLYYLP